MHARRPPNVNGIAEKPIGTTCESIGKSPWSMSFQGNWIAWVYLRWVDRAVDVHNLFNRLIVADQAACCLHCFEIMHWTDKPGAELPTWSPWQAWTVDQKLDACRVATGATSQRAWLVLGPLLDNNLQTHLDSPPLDVLFHALSREPPSSRWPFSQSMPTLYY